MTKRKDGPRRAPRTYTREFRQEAVRLMLERRAAGISLEQIARELARHRDEFEVRLMCRLLEVSSSGFYAAQRRAPSARAVRDQVLRLHVRAVHERSARTYGAPRVHQELKAEGHRVGRKRVARLMREDGLLVHRRRRRVVRTTDSAHAHPVAPNLLERRFDVNGVGINRVWVSDVTYVPTREGWLYLAIVLDLASRRVVGWAMRDTLEADLATSALRMALAARRPAPGLLHHSDRGCHYASDDYRALLAEHCCVVSMSRKGDCWDNAVAESFFATLEFELILKHDWPTRDAARRAIFRYVETWYNRERRHSTLYYVSPAQYEKQLQAA